MPFSQDDEERFEAFKDAITDSYATEPPSGKSPRRWNAVWFAVGAAILIVAAVVVGGIEAFVHRPQPVQILAQATAAPDTPVPPTARPHTPRPSTPQPTEPPTATPSAAKPSPTARPPQRVAVIHNAFLLVHSNKQMRVGKQGSCGGLDVTVEVRGYPKGCTVFDADSTGPLKNGRGTVLIVPVSTSEDVANVRYGLLYVKPSDDEAPRFVGLIRSRGSGRVVVRLQRGLILEQNGSRRRYFTYNGRRIVRARPS